MFVGVSSDSDSHVRFPSSDEVNILVDSSVASTHVNDHFCEDVPNFEHLSLVQAILSAHTINICSLIVTPRSLFVVGQLGEQLGVVGVVEAVPGVVVAKQVSYLSLV